MKGAKHKKLEQALKIWIGLLKTKNGTATDEVIRKGRREFAATVHFCCMNILIICPYFILNIFLPL